MNQKTKNPSETMRIAMQFGSGLRAGDFVGLEGALGAGKTLFVKGVAMGLGVRVGDEVKSPTFVIMHTYQGKVPVYHFDLYRLGSTREVGDIGFDEYAFSARGVTCVEWIDRYAGPLPLPRYHVRIGIENRDERSICICKVA